MHGLLAALIPIIVVIAVGLIIWYVAERFSPDPLITNMLIRLPHTNAETH